MSLDHADVRLVQEVKEGLDAEHFLHATEIGRYLQREALETERMALMELASCDPTDTRLVMNLQNKAHMPAMALEWIANIITKGKNAEALLNERHQN